MVRFLTKPQNEKSSKKFFNPEDNDEIFIRNILAGECIGGLVGYAIFREPQAAASGLVVGAALGIAYEGAKDFLVELYCMLDYHP